MKLEPRKENVCVNLYEKMPNFYKKKKICSRKKIIVNFFFIDLITIVVNIDVDEWCFFVYFAISVQLTTITYIKKILHLYISKKSYNCGI